MDTTRLLSGRVYQMFCFFSIFFAFIFLIPLHAIAEDSFSPPEPVVAIHVSELTQALETMPATPPTPSAGPDTTGYEWVYTSWHYFVAHESLKEALRSDGTPFVEISDADIISGRLLLPDGSPRYPIMISLASEAISDAEISPLRSYINNGGFLFVGSSAFTRNPDGTMRGDFALANEMGVHAIDPTLDNWVENMVFTKLLEHPLVSGIPSGALNWRMPLTSEEIPIEGIEPNAIIHGNHFIWQVIAADATTIATGASSYPLLTIKNYGEGTIIYHSAFQPLIGHGGFDSGMYAYLIYRNAIALAFQSANVPIIRLSPWRYPYDSAFIVRHDFENDPVLIRSIETSAAFESSVGVKGDYYFCTGTLRDHMADKTTVISSLRRAVSNYGASIGPHNGGLKNPVYPSLDPFAYDYWHWGPDDVLDATPPGYASGKAYAQASISMSFLDIKGWLSGVNNGRSGCGAAGNCPRIWVSPKFNSAREDSYDILDTLNAVTMGEQKIGPFPHWTLSTQTADKRYNNVSLPVSDWYAGSDVIQSLDDHTSSSMKAAVDFYYNLGALINLYGHNTSTSGNLQGGYVSYCAAKPRIWATNAVGVYDWWRLRSNVSVTPSYSKSGDTSIAMAAITGATDSNTSVEIAIPEMNSSIAASLQVFLNGSMANSSNYRTTTGGVKVKVGASVSELEVRYQAIPSLSKFELNPSSLIGGNSATGTVTLDNPAQAGGAVVTLSSSNATSAIVPASVTVFSGNTSAVFPITTNAVSSITTVTISAGYGGVVKTSTLTVYPASLPSSLSIWSNSAKPVIVADPEVTVGEVGVKFKSDVAGFITGLRFYKASTNTGTHVGSLWTSTGTLLGRATFTNETASGWQQVSFSSPVAISANTVYVASYHFNVGHYSCDENYFSGKGMDNPPLHALADGVFGDNGVGGAGSTSTFPTEGWYASNYWVDVVFSTTAPAPPTLVSIAVTPVNPTINAGVSQQFTATGTYSDASTQNLTSQATWSSSNTSVAGITSSGLATGIASGNSSINAAVGTTTGSTTLAVQAASLTINTTSLPAGTRYLSYSAALAASGGTSPYTWSIASGSLPRGLSLNSTTGVISGRPTTRGTFSFTARVRDSSSPVKSATKTLSVKVN